MLSPSASNARRSKRLLRMASAPTSRAGRTMSEKPSRSLRWKVTDQTYAEKREGGRCPVRPPSLFSLLDRYPRSGAEAGLAPPAVEGGAADAERPRGGGAVAAVRRERP